MTDPYNYPFIKKDNTMYLSTICTFHLMQLNWMSRSKNLIIDSPLFYNMISMELHPRCWYLRLQLLPTFLCLIMSNLYLMEARSLKKEVRIHYISMIYRGPDQRLHSLEQEEWWILYVPSIYFLRLLRSLWIAGRNFREIL